jgi:hypothetical protein
MKTAETTASAPPGKPEGRPYVVLGVSSKANLF